MMLSSFVWSPTWQLILVGLVGIVVWHVIPAYRANARMLAQLAFFGVMSTILVSANLVPFSYDGEATDTGALLRTAAKLLWWLHLAWAIIGVVRIYLVLEGEPREAMNSFRTLLSASSISGVALSVLAFVFRVPIGALIVASGAVAIIVGLAPQNTLSDVFSGIALALSSTLHVGGDWILLSNGVQGRVIESAWRSTYILTPREQCRRRPE